MTQVGNRRCRLGRLKPQTRDHVCFSGAVKRLVSENRLPHLLLYGPPGTGKTSTILAVARQMYPRQSIAGMVLELNASDDRGIGIVRQEIQDFVSTRTVFRWGLHTVHGWGFPGGSICMSCSIAVHSPCPVPTFCFCTVRVPCPGYGTLQLVSVQHTLAPGVPGLLLAVWLCFQPLSLLAATSPSWSSWMSVMP